MTVDPTIRAAIEAHPSNDVQLVSREVSQELKRFIPASMVIRVRGSLQRAANVNRAREHASSIAGDSVTRIEDVTAELLGIFNDETLSLKDRIEASKELRQWTKLGLDTAGIHDAETDTVFVIEGDWDMRPTSE